MCSRMHIVRLSQPARQAGILFLIPPQAYSSSSSQKGLNASNRQKCTSALKSISPHAGMLRVQFHTQPVDIKSGFHIWEHSSPVVSLTHIKACASNNMNLKGTTSRSRSSLARSCSSFLWTSLVGLLVLPAFVLTCAPSIGPFVRFES